MSPLDSHDEPTPADHVHDAVLAVPGVAALHGGMFGEAGTYLPGRRVSGIRLRDDVAEIHIAVHADASIGDTAEEVRAAVADLVATPVHLVVEDVVTA